MKRLAFVLALAVVVAGFLFAAWQFRTQRAEDLGFLAQENVETFLRPHAPTLGPADAKVYLVEFTDPACETCASFGPIIKHLMDAHPGKVQLVIRYAPFHEGSVDVVRMLEAARMQGLYWETLDLVYRSQSAWTHHHRVLPGRLWQILSQSGLDMERMQTDMNDPGITALIEQDMADVQTLMVRKTPGIFVNGRPLEPFSADRLAALLADEVRASYP